MKHDQIQINNETYRVEFNWNATVDFLETENLALTDVDSLSNLKPSQLTTLIFCGVKEGARMEEKTFPFSLKDFGAAIGVNHVTALVEIYTAQTNVKKNKAKPARKLFRPKK